MKITLENTPTIVTIVKDGAQTPARVWCGVTDTGIKVQALITRIAADAAENLKQFDAELQGTSAPSPESCAYPLRMIL